MEEHDYWKDQVIALRRNQLETVTKAATSWSALFSAVLAVFGAVAFAGGLTTLDKLASPWHEIVLGMTLLAAMLALAATVLAGLASGTTASETDDSTWDGLRDSTKQRAKEALGRLRLAKKLGAGAMALVVVGSSIVLIVGEDTSVSSPDVIAVVNGAAVCGPLTRTNARLSVAGTELTNVASITVVGACP